VQTRALSSRLYSSLREFGAIRLTSPLGPDVVIDNLRRSDRDVIVPEELREFGVTDFSAEVNGSQFNIRWVTDTRRFSNPGCHGFVRAVENGSRIAARFSATPIDTLLVAYLPIMALVGALLGRSQWYWVALAGGFIALLFVSQRNRGAEQKRARLIQLISIAAKAPL
jgi:hypothetical protein